MSDDVAPPDAERGPEGATRRIGAVGAVAVVLLVASTVTVGLVGATPAADAREFSVVTGADPGPTRGTNGSDRPGNASGGMRAITADRLVDRRPTLAATEEGYVVLWERLPADNELKDGREVFWAKYDGDGWSNPSPLTDNRKFDDHVDVAYDPTTGRVAAVWTRVTVALNESESARDVFRHVDQLEVFYAVYDHGTWSTSKRLTTDDRIDGSPTVVASNGTFHVVWQRGVGAGPKTLKHTTLLDPTDPINATRIGSAVYDVSAGAERPVRVAYLDPAEPRSRNGSVVVLAGEDRFRETARYPVTELASLELGPEHLVWRTGIGAKAESTVHDAVDGSVRTVGFDDRIRQPRDLRLVDAGGDPVLVYRAFLERNVTYRMFYKPYGGGEWRFDQPLNRTARPDFEFNALRAAATGDDLGIVFRAVQANRPDQNGDLIGIVRALRPDLTVDATSRRSPANVSVGDEATVSYTVHNRGDVNLTARFDAALVADGTVVAKRTHPAIPVGGRVNGTFRARVPATGRLTVRVDPADEIAETVAANDEATVVFARPDVAVVGADSTRRGSTVGLSATVGNLGGVAAGRVEVTLRTGNGTLATRTFDGLAPGANRTLRFEFGVDRVARAGPIRLVVTRPDRTPANDVWTFRPLVPEAGIVGNRIEFRRNGSGVVADVLVTNEGFGNATVPVGVQYPDGERIAGANVSVAGATGTAKLATARVRIDLPESALGKRVEFVVAEGGGAESGDDVVAVDVPVRPGDDAGPVVETFAATVADGRLRVEIVANESLARSSLHVDLSGPVSRTLTGEDFAASRDGRRYVANVSVDAAGNYTVELERVTDRSGNPLAGSPTANTRVGRSGPAGGLLYAGIAFLVVAGLAGGYAYRRRD